MSRARAVIGVLLCAVAALASTTPASGQTVEEYRARVDRLTRALEEIELEKRERDERLLSELDTVRVGRLVVITTPQCVAMVEDAARLEWPMIEPALRSEGPGEVAEEFCALSRPFPLCMPFRALEEDELGVLPSDLDDRLHLGIQLSRGHRLGYYFVDEKAAHLVSECLAASPRDTETSEGIVLVVEKLLEKLGSHLHGLTSMTSIRAREDLSLSR